jgi:nucleoside-triphosphatase THEP1
VGKTTAASRVAGLALTQGLVCGGLLAPAMLNGCGHKIGIWGTDLRTGGRRTLARTDRVLDGPSAGPYSFDADALDWATGVIERDTGTCDLLIVDEIGRLELVGGTGLAPVLSRLSSGRVGRSLVLVRDSLLDRLKTRLGPAELVLFAISVDNRQELPLKIADGLF